MFGSLAKTIFLMELEVIRKKSPAFDQGKSECCQSGLCCWRRPGELSSDDLVKLAQHFNKTEAEVFKEYLVVDYLRGDFILRLARVDDEIGRMLSAEETFSLSSPCIFLDIDNGNKCKIHEVKPETCVRYKCWAETEPTKAPVWTQEQLEALGWDGVER